MYKDTDLAYLAGIIDGEGSFSVYRTASRVVPQNPVALPYTWFCNLRVTNTDKKLMEWLTTKFDGSTGTHFNPKQRRIPIHQWKSLSNVLRELLLQLLPFLVIKHRHAEIMIEVLRLVKMRRGGNWGPIGQPARPYKADLAGLRNELISINAFRPLTGWYAYLDSPRLIQPVMV